MAAIPSFSMTREGETFALLGDREDVKARLAKQWDIRLDARREDSHGSDRFTIATYTRNDAKEAGRANDHFAEVFKVLHTEQAQYIRVVDATTGAVTQYNSKSYLQVCYDVFVLGKYVKASPEVEALLAPEEVTN